MKKKITNYLLVGLLATSIVGCGDNNSVIHNNSNNNNNNSNSNSNSNNNSNSNINNDNSNGNSVDINVPTIDELDFDVEFNDDGTVNLDYFENVQLELWSVIGDPDKSTLVSLIKEFNIEYSGIIEIVLTSIGHYEYYPALSSTYNNEREEFPDICLLHNEKNLEYAMLNYFYPLDELNELVGNPIDFDGLYDNIERTTVYKNNHFGVPIDAHGYLTQIRQDIVKKNNLGFDNNTRFVPNSFEEYGLLLQNLGDLAKSGELWTRNINLDQDHSWYQIKNGNPNLKDSVTKDVFYPTFDLYSEYDALTALYVNGGTLLDENGDVNFHKNDGFVQYITDQVDRFNNDLMGSSGEKTEMFGNGSTVMFSEGPWWIANTYSLLWNNKQLKTAGKLGVTEEDANDPIYSEPYAAARPHGWWANQNAPEDVKDKWYGTGHVIAVTSEVKSLQKIAAAFEFINWLTQRQDSNGDYNLTKWCKAGHIPAWKNVYEAPCYKKAVENSMTLKALGDPADIIALESARFATHLIDGLILSVRDVHAELQSSRGRTIAKSKEIINNVAKSTQEGLDLLENY